MEEVLMKKTVAVTAFSLTLVLGCLSVVAQNQTPSRDDILKQIEAKRAEIAALEKKALEPSDADRETYAEFLSGRDTGIIRLLPRETYDTNGKRTLTITGGGAFYSFVLSTHEYGRGSDISLSQGDLSAGGFGGFDHGMLLNVGDVELNQLTPEHLAVRALLEYKPSTSEADARKEHRRLWQGIDIGGFTFKGRLPAKVSNTYLLRSLSYDDSDIAVAFRVARQDTDGSLILVFKILKKFPAPKAERTQVADN
jgi:hypothetical protein